MTALYLHIPFCRSKCHYCSFSSCAGGSELYGPYVSALQEELSQVAGTELHLPLQSIFIGGGTPSILPCSLLTGILDCCRQLFAMAPGVEISVETNPGTVDEGNLLALFRAGVNRLSLGVQSFDDRELISLGRVHTAEEAITAVQAARIAGFSNLNLDLMCGLPGQTARSWCKTLDQALSLRPEHLSVYQLTIEPGTPFGDLALRRRLELPAEEEILEMDRQTDQACHAAGLQKYEISNYSMPGYECRHNVNYWLNGEYLACGASAVSYRMGVREKRTADVGVYIRRMETGLPVVEDRECLSDEASFRETVIMGLRLVRGISRDTLLQRYGRDLVTYYGATLQKLIDLGLVELTGTHLRLTEAGLPLANQVMAQLV
jgi:oxygen-independent coproporphyrinogen-3 oxidase